jgi:UDP-N-acetylglucosamine pyrophosphorylase
MIDFQLVVQHRAAGVLTSTNFNLDALVLILSLNQISLKYRTAISTTIEMTRKTLQVKEVGILKPSHI